MPQELGDWRRKSEFAETALAEIYEARSRLAAIRSPGAYFSEIEDRTGRNEENLALRDLRDTYYPVLSRLLASGDFFNTMYARRYRACALFGKKADLPYVRFWEIFNKIRVRTTMLMQPTAIRNDDASIANRRKHEEIIWAGAAEPDFIAEQINDAVAMAEAIFQIVLVSKVTSESI